MLQLLALTEAQRDVDRLVDGLRQHRITTKVPSWSIPGGIWKYVLCGLPRKSVSASRQLPRLIWHLFYAIRKSCYTPVLWRISLTAPLPKLNGKIGPSALD